MTIIKTGADTDITVTAKKDYIGEMEINKDCFDVEETTVDGKVIPKFSVKEDFVVDIIDEERPEVSGGSGESGAQG